MKCGLGLRSELTEEVSGIGGVAGTFAVGFAHDPLFAELIFGVVGIDVALFQVQTMNIDIIN